KSWEGESPTARTPRSRLDDKKKPVETSDSDGRHSSRALALLIFLLSRGGTKSPRYPARLLIVRRATADDPDPFRSARPRSAMPLDPLPFARLMGVSIVSITPDLVIGELTVREDLCTRSNVL